MLFNTLSYLAFLAVCVRSTAAASRAKRALILVGACFLRSVGDRVRPVLLVSAFVDYYLSLKIHADRNPLAGAFCCSELVDVLDSALLQYTYFHPRQRASIAGCSGTAGASIWHDHSSLGSFLHFPCSISYTIDVYRRLVVPSAASTST